MRHQAVRFLTAALSVMAGGAVLAQEGLNVDDDGEVGIGLTEPITPLHIFRDDNTLEFIFLESSFGTTQDRPMMLLSNDGGIRFQFDNLALGTSWRFQAATGNNDAFEVTKVGTGEIEMRVDAAGNLELQGTLTQNSDVNAKRDIVPVNPDVLLDRIGALPISEWSYASDGSGVRHLGPMAQDFHAAFGLGLNATSIAPGDMAGVSLAAVQALNADLQARARQVQALEASVEAYRAENEALERRLEALEVLLHGRAERPALGTRRTPAP